MTLFDETFRGRRVFVTGHTGFKGSWLTWWLQQLGAEVTGYALAADDRSWMFEAMDLQSACNSIIADVRDRDSLARAIDSARPDFVFHLAAQSLVLASYDDPLGTIETNVLGTANVLDALRVAGRRVVAILVTSDKCYENDGSTASFKETDRLGGRDVYSMSKGAAELVISSYRRSFFGTDHAIRAASARAGNVIGGGDWAGNRLVPDCVRALTRGEPIRLRNPKSVRPWQHVLEPLSGYLLLASKIASGGDFCEAWNFGPAEDDACTVEELVAAFVQAWGSGRWVAEENAGPHEAATLRLCTEKASDRIGWRPRWRLPMAVGKTVEWYKAQTSGADAATLRDLTTAQIAAYMRD